RAPSAMPMLPEAPALFSITTGCPHFLRQLLAHDARQQVGHAARGVGHDDPHRLRGPCALRARGERQQQARDDGARAPHPLPHRCSPYVSSIGRSRPARFAVSIASSYPASAWRITPDAGSLCSTRAMRASASRVPSQTITTPACCENPMPTPPPWWNETHVAPPAQLSRRFSNGQSDTASEPSRMASVSRLGLAT